MTRPKALAAALESGGVQGGAAESRTVGISQLNDLAISGLTEMFDAGKQLFCFRLKREQSGVVREGLSQRYTIMSLLGLFKGEGNGLLSPIDVKSVCIGLLGNTAWITNVGDLGLMMWLCALAVPEHLHEMCSSLDVQSALSRYPESQECRTMELAWFLSGIAHATLASPTAGPEFRKLATKTYQVLEKNQGESGIFGHLGTKRTLPGFFRGRIGSFADQVYPIYALARFAQAFEVPTALVRARNCADAIIKAQGPLGQWWWHYDSSTGKVLQRYPVYAVHQDGMAPMALFALGEATQSDFTEAIYRGLAWINGNNELKCDLRDTSSAVIWRSIYRPKSWKKYFGEIREFARPGRPSGAMNDLKVLFECRPYHLGWLLYALAGRAVTTTGAGR